MENLFTPEVIESFLKLLESATDGGVTAIIFWLLIPLLSTIVVGGLWAFVFIKLISAAKWCFKLAVDTPKKVDIGEGLLMDSDVRGEVILILKSVRRDGLSYVHEQDISRLKRAWEQYNNKEAK